MRFALMTMCLLLGPGSAVLLGADDTSAIFSDDFSTLDPAWGVASDILRVEAGKMVMLPKANSAYTLLYQGHLFNDADIRAKISETDGMADEPGGIVFWANGYDSFYVAALQTDGNFSVLRKEGEKWLNPVNWAVQDAVKKGLNQVNEIRVITKGSSAMIYVNNTQVASFKGFPPEGGGQIGVHAESGAQPYTWRFSDFTVHKPL